MHSQRQPVIRSAPIRLLLVGANEETFGHLRDVLSRTGQGHLLLDHAPTTEEAVMRLDHSNYDLLLCEYTPGDGGALRLLHNARKDGSRQSVIFLSDHVDEAAVDEALNLAGGDLVWTSDFDEPSIKQTIRYAIDVYCRERQQQKAEGTLRKLWRAVEQSADVVMITDLAGAIEYVNPAFEALTG